MAIKKPIPITFKLDSHHSAQSVCAVIHIDDKNTETLDLSLMQGGEHIAVSPNSTVTARFVRVKNNTLISDDVACAVQENGNIYIPIDNAAAHMLVGEIKIEVNIVDENDILTMQFPLVIRVNNTILADASICPISKGTIPELIEKAQETADNAIAGLGNKQDTLTAGDNITIENNVISAEGGGGSQIVSGVVNVNGTITFTDSEGNTFTTSGESVIGADGFSPSATVQQTASGATVSITDKNGTTTANISNGTPGQDYVLTAQDKEEIAGIVYEIGATPQYVIDESESVLAKAFAHKGLGRTIRFIAVSDSHNDATKVSHDYTRVSNMHCGQAVKYIADRIPLDFVASLGDMTWAGVAHTTAQYQTDWLKADIQEMNMFLKDGFSGVPNIRVVGNHDQCATTDSGGTVSRLQNSGAYQYFGRYNAGANDGLSNYGYYDIENVKLRIIYLNTSDTVSTTSQGTLLNVSQEQKNWLCETLIDVNSKSDAANWKILLLSHAPLDMVSGIAADILIPYTNGGTYGSYTFTNHNAKIIGNCHGHTHCYRVDYMADKIRRFTIPNSNFYDNNHYKDNANYSAWNEDTTYPKTANSRTDTSFSLVTVDLDSLTCYVDNYGAGYDREFSVDYNNVSPSYTNQIPISVDTNGNIYNGTGYKDDTGISSAGVERTKTGNLATGFIPYNYGDTIRIDRFDTTAAGDKNNGGVFFYDESKTYLGAKRLPTYVTEGKVIDGEPLVDTPESPVYDAGAGNDRVITSAKFIRVVFYDKSGQGESLIVTINEEI